MVQKYLLLFSEQRLEGPGLPLSHSSLRLHLTRFYPSHELLLTIVFCFTCHNFSHESAKLFETGCRLRKINWYPAEGDRNLSPSKNVPIFLRGVLGGSTDQTEVNGLRLRHLLTRRVTKSSHDRRGKWGLKRVWTLDSNFTSEFQQKQKNENKITKRKNAWST